MDKTVGVISLGCDKNRVDSESLLFYLKQEGFSIVNDISRAQIIVVNTCAFIHSARQESVDTILEAAENKRDGACEKLIVSGCFPVNYLDELKEYLPEVDAFIGTANYGRIGGVIGELYNGGRVADIRESDVFDKTGRVVSTPQHFAYLKIAEGCNNRCTYCTIPSIRGAYRSRGPASLIDEAKMLAEGGVKELILVAQDTTRYGSDLSKENEGSRGLIKLTESLCKIDGIEWIRLMYCYPELVTGGLIDTVASNDKVVKYLDIPLQHSEDRILKMMGRRTDGGDIRRLIERIRVKSCNIALRSSFIVGFPGETDAEFAALCGFLREYRLEHAGFFGFSDEDGTPASKLSGKLNKSVIRKRVIAAGKTQKEVIKARNKSLIGQTIKVLYEGIDYDRQMFYGRAGTSAPEVDTYIYFNADFADVGQFYDIMITGTAKGGYDLTGKKLN